MRTVIARHEQPGARWLLATRVSAPAVRDCVPSYVGYEECTSAPLRRLEVPHPNVTMIVNLGARLEVHAPALQASGASFGSFAAGVFDTVVLTESTGDSAGIELNLTPLGMWQLVGVPLSELTNRVLDLELLFGPAARAIEEQLRNTSSWDARFDLLDTLLTTQLQRHVAPSRAVQWAWRQIVARPPSISVSDVARELQWSRRRLSAVFREHVGMTPKAAARIARFDRVVRHVRSGQPVRWTALSTQYGYADQAHLVREFREFSGLSPTEFVRQQTAIGLSAE